MPTFAALSYRHALALPMSYPHPEYSYAENLLCMMFDMPNNDYQPPASHASAIDAFLLLHADHEQNASTTAVRIAASTGANPYACVASAVTALWGPRHGGANEACLKQLLEIGSIDKVADYIAKVKDKKTRLMGFGHRIYKHYDPRAAIMKDIYHTIAHESSYDPLFEVALALEESAAKDGFFVERDLYPNVDFYSGLVLRALSIPPNMFTVMFALGRSVGWIAHLLEQLDRHPDLIIRPRQRYIGPIIT
jgi:citrate synthase